MNDFFTYLVFSFIFHQKISEISFLWLLECLKDIFFVYRVRRLCFSATWGRLVTSQQNSHFFFFCDTSFVMPKLVMHACCIGFRTARKRVVLQTMHECQRKIKYSQWWYVMQDKTVSEPWLPWFFALSILIFTTTKILIFMI